METIDNYVINIILNNLDFNQLILCRRVNTNFNDIIIKNILNSKKLDQITILKQMLYCNDNNYIESFRWLVNQFISIINNKEDSINHLLHSCCSSGNIEILKLLIKKCKINKNKFETHKKKLIYNTCQNGHLEILKWLIKKFRLEKSDISAYDCCVIRLSCNVGHLGMLKWLLNNFEFTVEEIRVIWFDYIFETHKRGGRREDVYEWLFDLYKM